MRSFAMRVFAVCIIALFTVSIVPDALFSSSFDLLGQEQESQAEKKKKEKELGLPLKPERKIEFTTDEGSWMSIDVSPDGRTIVFEMIGDLYTMPANGGKAMRISSGMAMDSQPRYSPDGTSVVFVSDRSGGDNIWTMDPAKSIVDETKETTKTGLKRITKGEDNRYTSPEWTPDGKYIIASKSHHLWMYHVDGGSGVDLMKDETNGRKAYGAAFGKDERYIYFASAIGPTGYNQLRFVWQIAMYDRETGTIFPVASRVGGAIRPILSPDGNWLVYGSRYDAQTGLRLRNINNGEESWLAYPVQRDDMESRFSRDLYPGYTFMPDSKSIIATAEGKLWNISVPDGKKKKIEFEVDVSLDLGPSVNFTAKVEDGPIKVRQIRNPVISPDGQKIAFTSLHKLYVQDLPDGKPKKLTDMEGEQFQPVWSPDGSWIAFVNWLEHEGGNVYKIRANGGKPVQLNKTLAYYSDPVWRPDGSEVIVVRGPWQQRRDDTGGQGRDLFRLSADGETEIKIAPIRGSRPHFADRNDRIYIYEGGTTGLVSMRFDGTDRKTHVKVTRAGEIVMGADGEKALVMFQNHVYRITVPVTGGEAPTISVDKPEAAAFPVEQLTTIGASFMNWGPTVQEANWSIGTTVFRYNFEDAKAFKDKLKAEEEEAEEEKEEAGEEEKDEEKDEAKKSYEPATVTISLEAERYMGKGTVVLRGAKILTMDPDRSNNGIIDDGAIVITDNRITEVGSSSSIRNPRGATEINVRGKVIIPGFVDTHSHMAEPIGVTFQPGVMWPYVANLAYGVTTTRDPQTSRSTVFDYTDLVEAGELIGPRVFATGPGVFSRDKIDSFEDAQNVLKRYSEYYRTNTIKQYMVGNRKKRQWVITAAKEQGLMPTVEGGLDLKKNITEIIDGYSGHEHSFPIAPLYRDFVELVARAGTFYTPTLLVSYGAPWAENYFYETTNVHDDAKLRRFMPHSEIDKRALRRPWFAESEHGFKLLAEVANKIVKAGGRVGVGSHGQLQGLGYHWELWAIQSGGMSEFDALRCATIFGAEAIGYIDDLGSLSVGKMADLIVLNSDPLENIRNTNDMSYVMKNGLLYETETLDMVWPEKKKFPKPYWLDAGPDSGKK